MSIKTPAKIKARFISYFLLVDLANKTNKAIMEARITVAVPPVIIANKIMPSTPKDIAKAIGRKAKAIIMLSATMVIL